MKPVTYLQILAIAFVGSACSSNQVEKSPQDAIVLKVGDRQNIEFGGKRYDLLVYDVRVIFSEGYVSEDQSGILTTLYNVGLMVDQDSVNITAVTSVSQTGKRNLLSFERLSAYPPSSNYVKTVGDRQVAVSDVYQEPEEAIVKPENYKVALLLR